MKERKDDPTIRIPAYAVLDDQSTDVFITNTLIDKLQTDTREVNLEVSTIVGNNTIRAKKVNGLQIEEVEGRYQPMRIPNSYSRDQIPASCKDIATQKVAESWKHLQRIACHIHHRPDVEIGMVI